MVTQSLSPEAAAPGVGPNRSGLRAMILRALRLAGPPTRRKLRLMVPLGVSRAGIELGALALLLPLVDSLVTGGEPSRILEAWASLFGAEARGEVLVVCGVSAGALLLVKSMTSMAFSWWQFGVLTEAEAAMATDVLADYLDASVGFHARHNTADAIRNVNSAVNGMFRQVLIPMVTTAVELASMSAVILMVAISDPLVMLVLGLAFSLLAAGFLVAVARPARLLGDASFELRREALRHMQEGIAGVKILQAFNRQEAQIARFAGVRADWRPVRHRASFLGSVSRHYLEMALVVGLGLQVGAMTVLRSSGDALGGLAVTMVAAFLVLPSVGRILGQLSTMRLGQAAVDRLEMALAELEEDRRLHRRAARRTRSGAEGVDVGDSPSAGRSEPFGRSVELEDLGVTYPGGHRALGGVDLEIRNGATLGIVGRSGAGKTTLVDVLLGLVRPTAGRLVVDGRELLSSDWSWWRSQIGYVPQDTFLLDDSVEVNVTLAEPHDVVDRVRLDGAIHRAQLHDVVAQLPDGIDTRLGERGMRLSGGQRQRLGLARALYRDPQILVLDEATSALDLTTEAEVQKVLTELRDELTIIVVAHRLSTVRFCDRIAVMHEGAVESIGSFDQLRVSSALFNELMTLDVDPSWDGEEPTIGPAIGSGSRPS